MTNLQYRFTFVFMDHEGKYQEYESHMTGLSVIPNTIVFENGCEFEEGGSVMRVLEGVTIMTANYHSSFSLSEKEFATLKKYATKKER